MGLQATIVALMMSVAVAVGVAGPAGADPNCDPGNWTHRFDGWYNATSFSQYIGVSARIEVNRGAVCDADPNPNLDVGNFNVAWSMIASGNGDGWAQSGYARSWGTNIYHFSQQYRGQGGSLTSVYCTWCGALATGEIHQYWQQWDPVARVWNSNVDQTIFQTTSTSFRYYWTTPYSPQYAGETKYMANNMPGTPSNTTLFDQMSVQAVTDAGWGPQPCPDGQRDIAVNSNPARWASAGYSCLTPTAQAIWTK